MNKYRKIMYTLIVWAGIYVFMFLALYIMGLICQWYGIN
jgi:hypothetical protein